jgi:hypothetical protein
MLFEFIAFGDQRLDDEIGSVGVLERHSPILDGCRATETGRLSGPDLQTT